MHDRWNEVAAPRGGHDALPDLATLEGFFSVCYQASLLREEERSITFRAVLASPAIFPTDGCRQRVCSVWSSPLVSIRRQRAQAAFRCDRHPAHVNRVQRAQAGGLRIWGLINSGSRWLRDVRGGRRLARLCHPHR